MLFISGFAVSVINGMIYKIVPFLVWMHLQGQSTGQFRLPNMKEIIPDRWARRQYYLHLISVPLLACAVVKPVWFLYPATTLFAFSSLLLFLNIYTALQIYRDVRMKLSVSS
jgi:hypothetical protein